MMTSLLLLLAAGPVAQAPTAAEKATLPYDRVECRMIQEVSSRIPVRVCRLSKEWELLAQDAQEDLRSSRNQRNLVR